VEQSFLNREINNCTTHEQNENSREQNKYPGTKIFMGLLFNSRWNKIFLNERANNYIEGNK
jgi:hypothetical protein